jgi:hypothetical protein
MGWVQELSSHKASMLTCLCTWCVPFNGKISAMIRILSYTWSVCDILILFPSWTALHARLTVCSSSKLNCGTFDDIYHTYLLNSILLLPLKLHYSEHLLVWLQPQSKGSEMYITTWWAQQGGDESDTWEAHVRRVATIIDSARPWGEELQAAVKVTWNEHGAQDTHWESSHHHR